MSGLLPSFVNGSNILLKMGDVTVAYCQDLRFNRNMANVPVRGIGSYSTHATEPVDFSASGQMSIIRYNKDIVYGNTDTGVPNRQDDAKKALLPENLQGATASKTRDGNSLLMPYAFDPRRLLLSATFDIEVYERTANKAAIDGTEGVNTGGLLYHFYDCRLTSYSHSFSPGQLIMENVAFLASYIEDSQTSLPTYVPEGAVI